MLSRSQVLAQFWSAVRVALRDLPDGATGVRVYGGHESATVCVTGDGGELVVCTVRQRTAAAGDGRQLTIDDALASRKTVTVNAPAEEPHEEPAAVPVEEPHEEPAKAPLYFSFQPHAAADALASKRGRSMVFVYADGNASVEARTGEESIFFREYWSGACGWDSRDLKPETPAEKPKKAKKAAKAGAL
jgi:hypothetical protein